MPRDAQRARIQRDQEERLIRLARFWQAGEAEEESTYRLQSKDATEDQDSSQDRRQIPSRQGRKGRGSWGKEVVQILLLFVLFCEWNFSIEVRLRLPSAGSPHLANHDTDSCKGYSD